jgi:hypothetical protein
VKKYLLILLLFVSCALQAQDNKSTGNIIDSTAQKVDSTLTQVDTFLKKTIRLSPGDTTRIWYAFNVKKPIPKRSAFYSACLPGLGQYYNKDYWKIAVVYAGFGYAAWRIDTVAKEYNSYRKAIVAIIDNDPSTEDPFDGRYGLTALADLRTRTRARLDKLVVYTAAWYGLNIIDALTAAHLKNFDISKDISMRIAPAANPQYVGLAFTFNKK